MLHNFNHFIFLILMSISYTSSHFFLLDGRAANYEAMRYSIGDSYYYSKLLCSTDFASNTHNTTNSTIPTLTLRPLKSS